MRRAQTAIEFLVLIGFMLFIFTAFFLVIQERSTTVKQQRYYNDLSYVGDMLVQEVRLAQQVRSGYCREFDVPGAIAGNGYFATMQVSATCVCNDSATPPAVNVSCAEYSFKHCTKVYNPNDISSGYVYGVGNETEVSFRQNESDAEYLVFLPVRLYLNGNLSGSFVPGARYSVTKNSSQDISLSSTLRC